MQAETLLSLPPGVRITDYAVSNGTLHLMLISTSSSANCPMCRTPQRLNTLAINGRFVMCPVAAIRFGSCSGPEDSFVAGQTVLVAFLPNDSHPSFCREHG
jgi:hypothetical protein